MTNGIATQTNGITLLPCPFCGGEAAFEQPHYWGPFVEAKVTCIGVLEGNIYHSCGQAKAFASARTIEDAERRAVEKWNRRA